MLLFPSEIIEVSPFNQPLRKPPLRRKRAAELKHAPRVPFCPFGSPYYTPKFGPGKITFPILPVCVCVCVCVCVSVCMYAHTSFFTAVLLMSSVMLKPRLWFSFLGMKLEDPRGLPRR